MINQPYPLYNNPQIKDLKEMIRKLTQEEPEAIAFSSSKGNDEVTNKF